MQSHSHALTPKTYIAVLAALLSLTMITVLAAGANFGSGSINVVIALAVATFKATLVAPYFMHLRHDKPMNAIIFLTGLLFLGVFLIFCFVDTHARDEVRPANLKPLAASAVSNR